MPCARAILAIFVFIRTTNDNKTSGHICFIDLRKTFETLNPQILLNNPTIYGFSGTVLNLLRDYLSDRWQFVSINDKPTRLRKTETSVPQSSVPGPLFFLLYINDLEVAMQDCKITMFAVDTLIYHGNSLPSQSPQKILLTQ